MRRQMTWLVISLLTVFIPPAQAVEKSASYSVEPLARYSFVKGDEEKFRAQQWVRDGFAGGVREFYHAEKMAGGAELFMEGRAIVDDNDYAGKILLRKEDLGFLNFDYREFSRTYDGTGGVYYPFQALSVNDLDKDLELDIGRLTVEAGLTLEDLPELVFFYERRFKEGSKSRLTWTAVREGTLTRNIGPAFQEMDETTDSFGIRLKHPFLGFDWSGEQRWELMHADLSREEKLLSTTAAASTKKIRTQKQEPESQLVSTTVKAEKWIHEGKTFAGFVYRFVHLTNKEVESIFETDANLNPMNFSNPKQIRDAVAHNRFDSNTWAGNFFFTPQSFFNVIFNFKAETIKRDGYSSYPSDSTPAVPDGVINTTEMSNIDNKLTRFGEGISLRYSGIPYTVLYHDVELEQIRNWLVEDRVSIAGQSAANPNEVFNRETITESWRGTYTAGVQVNPWPFLSLSGHYRHREQFNNYDDVHETDPGASTARSAFINSLDVETNEIAARVTLKPARWIRPSFRYQFRGDDYTTQVEAQDNVETDMNSFIYTGELSLQPADALLLTGSYSVQNAWTVTPAVSASTARTPLFKADVQTVLFTGDYTVTPSVSLTGTAQYSRADNFDDFTPIGLPLGADFRYTAATLGLRVAASRSVTVEPFYGFYRYTSEPHAEVGDYDAHVIAFKVVTSWG